MLALKGNQGHLLEDVQQVFAQAQAVNFAGIAHDFYQTVDKGYGRIEVRRYWTMEQVECLSDANAWAKFTRIGGVQAERRVNGKVERETRYYISSLSSQAPRFAQAVRSHWTVENSLHWVLDRACLEEACRIRQEQAPENLAVVRHIALNLLTQENTLKIGIKNKRLWAGWDEDYLLKLLVG